MKRLKLGKLLTNKPKVTAMMTVVTMEMAARFRSPRCPANACVMTVMENIARRLKMEGPAICHNFFDSFHVLVMRVASLDDSSPCSFCSGLESKRGLSSSLLPICGVLGYTNLLSMLHRHSNLRSPPLDLKNTVFFFLV